jgi:4-hydroxy-3-methylbut-2-enyl diphosphate reductase
MRVIRAEAMGLCFGVRDALEAAAQVANPQHVTIRGELVHNEAVLVQLQTRGFGMIAESDRAVPATGEVLITAHGISDRERRRLISEGKTLIDTTCPLVRRLHLAAQSLAAKGYQVVVIGRRDHVEVRGIVEDLASYEVVGSPAEVRTWPHARLGIVCQTTTPPHVAAEIEAAIRERNGHAEIRFADTICEPTRERQSAVERLCRQVDAVVVVGGSNSNNTRQLVALCERLGTRACHVQSADGIDPGWFAGCTTVGLTAGTSTLDETINEVYQRLRALPGRACA